MSSEFTGTPVSLPSKSEKQSGAGRSKESQPTPTQLNQEEKILGKTLNRSTDLSSEALADVNTKKGLLQLLNTKNVNVKKALVKLRYERRDLKTFCADCSKQAGQQMVGGALMVGMGLMLAKESGLDALAWYGAQYPFEIVLTTVFTGGAAW